jgi:signal peptidase I
MNKPNWLAPFGVKSFRFQWPSDLTTSWAFEMETLILGWYILIKSESVILLVIFGALQYFGALVSPLFGVAGDRIICCTKDDKLSVNGVEIDEPYIFAGNKPSEMTFDVTVPEGKIWVMGDHRGASADSRYHQEDINKGFVPVSKVTGRVVAVIWPFKNITYVPKVDVLNK